MLPASPPDTVIYVEPSNFVFSWRKLLRFAGPGLLMSVAYVDPGNLESDLQVGANTGYVLLWLLLWSTVLGFIVQMQAAKLGVATGKHLAEHCRAEFPPVPRYLLWIMAEIAIIGADVQEVIGSAIALSLLSQGSLPLWVGVLISAVSAFGLLLVERFGVRYLEGMFGILIGSMVAAFGVMYVRAGVPTGEVVVGFLLPKLPRSGISEAVALVGSLIMPHNIYLHSALVRTRKLQTNSEVHKKEAIFYFGLESGGSLLITAIINMCVISVFAAGFYGRTPADLGLQNAGEYLGRTYGPLVVVIWGLGLLAAGQSSTMTGTYTGQFLMDGYLNMHVSPWARIMITRLVAIVPTMAIAIIYRDSNQLDVLNQWLNLLQSMQLPFALIPLLAFNSNRRILGKFVNSLALNLTTWSIALMVVGINLTAVVVFFEDMMGTLPRAVTVLFSCWVVMYAMFVLYLAIFAFNIRLPWSLGGRAQPPRSPQATTRADDIDEAPLGSLHEPLLPEAAKP